MHASLLNKWASLSLVAVGIWGCASEPADVGAIQATPQLPAVVAMTARQTPRKTYWPLDQKITETQTMVKPYQITVVTRCLNDSAVVNTVKADAGETLDISHNYASDIRFSQTQHPTRYERITKTMFQDNAVAKKLGPLQQLVLSRITCLGRHKGIITFSARLGVPDSDIFVIGEFALLPVRGMQLVKVVVPPASE